MTQRDWADELASQVGAEIKRNRTARKVSAQRLADACVEEGLPISREVIANLENGRRPTISLAELLVIARVLNINPIDLVIPGDAPPDKPYAVAPRETTTVARARAWITGHGFLAAPATPAEFADVIRALSKERASELNRAYFDNDRTTDWNRQTNRAERAVDPDGLGGFWGSDGGFVRTDGASYSADEIRQLLKGDKGND